MYDRWRAVGWALLGLIVWIQWWRLRRIDPRDQEQFATWQLRLTGLQVVFWAGWAIADAARHSWPWLAVDGLFLGWHLRDLWKWWRRNKQRKVAQWLGYKAEAIRLRLQAAGGAA